MDTQGSIVIAMNNTLEKFNEFWQLHKNDFKLPLSEESRRLFARSFFEAGYRAGSVQQEIRVYNNDSEVHNVY